MYLGGDAPLPGRVRLPAARRGAARAARRTSASACCSRSTARTSAGSAPTRPCSARPRSSSTSTTTTTTRASAPSTSSSPTPRRRPRSSRDLLARARRRRSRRRSPRRCTSGSSPTPGASSTRTRRRRRCGSPPSSSRPAPTCTSIFRHVYETVQFAKLKLLARALEPRALYEGGRLVVSYLLRADFAEVGRRGAVLRGDHRLPARERGLGDRRADPRAAAATAGPTHRISLRSSRDEVDVSAIARKSGGGGHRPGGRLLERAVDRRDRRVPPPRVRRGAPARPG